MIIDIGGEYTALHTTRRHPFAEEDIKVVCTNNPQLHLILVDINNDNTSATCLLLLHISLVVLPVAAMNFSNPISMNLVVFVSIVIAVMLFTSSLITVAEAVPLKMASEDEDGALLIASATAHPKCANETDDKTYFTQLSLCLDCSHFDKYMWDQKLAKSFNVNEIYALCIADCSRNEVYKQCQEKALPIIIARIHRA